LFISHHHPWLTLVVVLYCITFFIKSEALLPFFVWILCTQKWLNIVHSLTKLRMRKLHEIYHILNASFSHLSFLIEYLLGQNCECTEHWLIKLKYAWIVINFKTTVWKIFSLLVLLCFVVTLGDVLTKVLRFCRGKWAWLGNLWIIC